MSETETTVLMDDKALFESAIANEPETPAAVTEEKPAEQTDGPARDEQGRFAAKDAPQEATEQVAPEPAAQDQQPNRADWIPPYRVREEAERARAAEDRSRALEQQLHQLSSKLQQLEKPQEPLDPFADPEKFADQRVKQAVDPIAKRQSERDEYYSRKDAIRTHGQETVDAAFDWLEKADRSGDPRAQAFIASVKQSIDPFEDIITAYKRDKALATVGNDPNAWFEKELARRMESDPAFKAKFGVTPAQGSPTNIVKLPPSLNRQPGSAGNAGEVAGMDDMSLYQHAIR